MIKFTKMTALGNDYVYINCLENDINTDISTLAKNMSDRHFGIGSDGIVFIRKGNKAPFFMDMYNSDGSSSDMCGNALRSIAKYIYDNGIEKKDIINIETRAGVYPAKMFIENDKVKEVEVNMGSPRFAPHEIPINNFSSPVLNQKIKVKDREFKFSAVSIGNPHCVIFLENGEKVKDFPVEEYGKIIENHELFPERTNVEFIEMIDSKHVIQRTWERGAGETLACGSGASAVLSVGVANKILDDELTISLLGGDLKLRWDREKKEIYQRGGATIVFNGDWLL